MAETTIVELIKGDIRAWTIGKALEIVLAIFIALESIEKKVDRHLRASFEQAKSVFELAQQYREYEKQKAEFQRARFLFEEAAFKLVGIEKIHALCLAGICANLAGDSIAKKHYYQLALGEIDAFMSKEKNQRWRNRVLKSTGVGTVAGALGAGSTTLVLGLMSGFMFGPAVLAYYAILFGSASGLISGAVGATTGTISGAFIDIENIKLELFKCTLGELKGALVEGEKLLN